MEAEVFSFYFSKENICRLKYKSALERWMGLSGPVYLLHPNGHKESRTHKHQSKLSGQPTHFLSQSERKGQTHNSRKMLAKVKAFKLTMLQCEQSLSLSP